MRNKPAAVAVQNDDFFRYNPVPARRPNEVVFAETAGSGNFNYSPPTMSNTLTDTVSNPTTRLTPLRRPSGPVILEPPYLHRQMSQQSDLDLASTSTTSGRNRSEPSNAGNVDIRALAQEVAAVLYQSPAKNYSSDRRGTLSVQNDDDANTSQLNHQQPPPNYRTVTGASSSIGSPGKSYS